MKIIEVVIAQTKWMKMMEKMIENEDRR